jgi:tRNA G10  N-methylase Trm11
VDPFCGTGGIAIEAALQGIEVLASDLDPRMVEGTLENLEWAGTSAKVETCGASEIASLWGNKSNCCFVFDPPYGRSSWKSGDGAELFLEALAAAHDIDPSGSLCTMLPTGPEALDSFPEQDVEVLDMPWSELESQIRGRGWEPVLSVPIKVHRSLARMVVVCHPAD